MHVQSRCFVNQTQPRPQGSFPWLWRWGAGFLMLLLPLPPLFCKVPIVYATHWRHKALICLLQISNVARFRPMWGSPEQSWVLDNIRTGFQIRCQWNLDSGFLKLNSWFQSPRFRIPQAKNPACLNPDYLSWGDMIQGWILREGVGSAHPPPPILTCAFPISNTTGILHKKVFVPYLCWSKTWEEVDWNCMVNTVRMVVKMIVS